MDVSLVNNVLEGTRQYFMGVPKQAQAEGSGQPVWPAGAPLPEEGAPARSGAPAPSSRPPSAAAAPPSVLSSTPIPTPPRPPSEPLEPEPHIIHKATVMREAAEKRREQPDIEDEDPGGALSPPSHIIRKPARALPSPAPAPAAPSPLPARPPSNAPPPPPSDPQLLLEPTPQYRAPIHRVQTPTRPADHYAAGRPPDPYSSSRPPETYVRYQYESNATEGNRNAHRPVASPQPSTHPRQSPQSYSRLSSSMPQYSANRLRDVAAQSPPAQRYSLPPTQPPPPPNDRVPPIHHPQATASIQRHSSLDSRPPHMYANMQQRREQSSHTQGSSSHYNRHPSVPQRKHDSQQAYPGYRPAPVAQPVQSQRVDTHHNVQYKHAPLSAQYTTRHQAHHSLPLPPQPHDATRLPPRSEYPSMSRPVDPQNSYHYQMPSTSSSRYGLGAQHSSVSTQNITQQKIYRTGSKSGYDYPPSTPVQTSPARSSVKPGYPNQTRMTVSVTSLVNEWNQNKQKQETPAPAVAAQVGQPKQKRESPLDLSVKTVKHSADSSTTHDDVVDSATSENKIMQLQHRSSSGRHSNLPTPSAYGTPHKIDFSPNFNQCGDRSSGPSYTVPPHSSRYNGAYETRRPSEPYHVESPLHHRNKYSIPNRSDHISKIDRTRHMTDQRHPESRLRDDRHIIIEERKRPAGPIASNIPEKIVRYETWTSDSRIDHFSPAREQRELMEKPVYSFLSHKHFEAYQNEQKRSVSSAGYREHPPHANHRYPNHVYPQEIRHRESRDPTEYNALYHEKSSPLHSRHHVIKNIPSHRDIHPHQYDPRSGIPADKNVLSLLRNTLETKHIGFVEPPRLAKQITDTIVIDVDDADDSVIEITDLTKDNDTEIPCKNVVKPSLNQINPNKNNHIQMPKAVDSLPGDYEYSDSPDPKSKSTENDVASRIRTKAELKVMPPSQDNISKPEIKPDTNKPKILPRKTHLFNQMREDNLRLESVIKNEGRSETITIPEVKSEPMNIEEIEKDAVISIKTESILESFEREGLSLPENEPADDLDWASACDSFMEQLKSGCHKKKSQRKRYDTLEDNDNKLESIENKEEHCEKTVDEIENKVINSSSKVEEPNAEDIADQAASENMVEKLPIPQPVIEPVPQKLIPEIPPAIVIKQEPIDEEEINDDNSQLKPEQASSIVEVTDKSDSKLEQNKSIKKKEKEKLRNSEKCSKNKVKTKVKTEKNEIRPLVTIKKEPKDKEEVPLKRTIKEESESTDDDEPLILKSKVMKQKKENERLMKFQLLKDLSEKSAYVKLECCDVDVNKNTRKSLDSVMKDREDKHSKGKLSKQSSRSKRKISIDNNKNEPQEINSSSDSDDDDVTVASRLRLRKSIKNEDSKTASVLKTPVKSSPSKKHDNSSAGNSSTPVRKPTFGDGSYFHPGWEEELYKYKRSLRMPTRLIAIPRGRSGGPFVKGTGALFSRGSTSLPDLDPAPLSPAPSSAQSAATDDLYARRTDKSTLDSDLDSNSSYSTPNKLHYDSEASTSTVLSTKIKRKGSSIVDVLMQKYGKKENSKKDSKRNKSKDKDVKTPKTIPKKSNDSLSTPSSDLVKNNSKENLKKEKSESIFYLEAFGKETISSLKDSTVKDTDGLIGTNTRSPAIKSRTRTESRVLKQRATIKEVFGDERPASAPPTSCREENPQYEKEEMVEIKKEPEQPKPKFKPKKITKDKLKRRSSSIRDGLRSTKSLKRNDAKGRFLRLKKRNSLMVNNTKRMKGISAKHKSSDTPPASEQKDKSNEEGSSLVVPEVNPKRRLKRLFGRRKFSSGFDYIRKKKKIIRREETGTKVRRPASKPSPESVHDIQKEIKGWFINKSIGETHLHRAARLGYTDCVAYCLEKLESDPTAKDNAGFTPLHVAAAKGHVRIARLLLQYGANVSAAAQGGIRPLHEACENGHVEVIRLLLAYGADPLLGTYAGQTPEELTEGPATALLRLHIEDVQGRGVEPWRFPPPAEQVDREELGCDALSSPPPASPPPPPDATIEIQCTDAPLPPFYSLRTPAGQPTDGLWCLLQDITNLLQIKSKESLLKQIHCGSGSPKELLREIRTQEFLERAQCHQLLCAGEKVNVRASKVALVRVTDKLRQLLKIETVLVS